jgi:hypothetical protein
MLYLRVCFNCLSICLSYSRAQFAVICFSLKRLMGLYSWTEFVFLFRKVHCFIKLRNIPYNKRVTADTVCVVEINGMVIDKRVGWEMHTKFSGKREAKKQLWDLSLDRRIMLKWIQKRGVDWGSFWPSTVYSPPTSAEVKKKWIYTSTPLYVFMA